ncbi:MAG: DUF2256 domain-containing protein [Pseudanabaena sp. ELA607]|jgi:hypothetical protein
MAKGRNSHSLTNSGNKNLKKGDLPQKDCLICQRPFTWRKKWADCWDEVKYCSERCRRHK